MRYALLGPTGVKVSAICLGTATFGVAPNEREAERTGGMERIQERDPERTGPPVRAEGAP